MASAAGGFQIATGYVEVLPSTGGFARQLAAQMRGMDPVRIPIQIDAGEVRRQIRDAGQQGGDAGQQGGRQIGTRITAGLKAGLVGAGAVVVATLGSALREAATAGTTGQAKLQAQFGATATQAKAAGAVAQQVFRQNFGESLADVQTSVGQVAQSLGGFGKISQAELGKAATGALTIRDTFGVEIPETIRAATSLVRSGVVPDMTAAMDVITSGMQSGANISDDWIDTLNEYPGQFAKLGLSGQDALNLVNQGLGAGARSSDLVADAIKEFSIRAVDGGQTTAQGFQLAGLNADQMTAKIAAGGPTARAAFSETLTAINSITDPVLRNQALVDLFGTQAEDLGPTVFKAFSLSSQGITNVAGSTARAGEALYSTPQQKLSAFVRTIKADLVGYLGGVAVPRMIQFAHAIAPLFTLAGQAIGPTKAVIAGVIATVSAAIGFYDRNRTVINTLAVAVAAGAVAWYGYRAAVTAVTTAQWIWQTRTLLMGAATRAVTGGLTLMQGGIQGVNAAMRANMIGIIITLIIAAAAAFIYAYTHSERFRAIVQAALGGVVTAARAAWSFLSGFGLGVVSILRGAGDGFSWLYGRTVGVLIGIRDVSSGAIGWYLAIYRGGFAMIIGVFQGGFAVIRGVAEIALGALLAAVRIWWTAFTLPFRIGFAIIRGLFQFWGAVFRGDWEGAWNAISGTTTRILGLVRGTISSGMGAIKGVFTTTLSGIRTIWDGLREVAASPVRFVVNTVYNSGIRRAWNAIVAKIPGVPDMAELKVPGLAAGGPITGGVPGRDSVLRRLMPGEHVLTADEVDAAGGHDAIFALRRMLGGGTQATGPGMLLGGVGSALGSAWNATGGKVVDKLEDLAREGVARGFELALSPVRAGINATLGTGDDWRGALGKLVQQPFTKLIDWVRGKESAVPAVGGGGGGGGGAGVERWRAVALQALSLAGQPASWIGLLLRRMNQESGGNPRAINNWDSNAKRGDPSRGLMQTIGSTFNAYAGPYRGRGIYDPLANIYASIKYTLAAYGSLSAWGRAGGYAKGGLPPAGVPFWVGEEGPELMMLGRGARASVTPAQGSPGPQIVNHFHLDRGLSTPEVVAEMQRRLALAVA